MLVGEGWCSWFYTPVCSYKFHALTVYLHSTFTTPLIGGAFGIQSSICRGAFCRNSQRVKVVGYFCRRAPSWIFDRMFDRILNATRPNNLLQIEEGLQRSFPPLELHKGILDSSCLLILLIYTNNAENPSTTYLDKTNTSD